MICFPFSWICFHFLVVPAMTLSLSAVNIMNKKREPSLLPPGS